MKITMFIAIQQFYPATDMKEAVCLYEAPSIDQLSEYLNKKLGDVSTQYYFPIMTEHAMGLPKSGKG